MSEIGIHYKIYFDIYQRLRLHDRQNNLKTKQMDSYTRSAIREQLYAQIMGWTE